MHGHTQSFLKRGLPRALMTDNGAPFTAAEFEQGLLEVGVVHELTLPYSPYQNGKQEVFWVQIETRLLAMLEGVAELTLGLLNESHPSVGRTGIQPQHSFPNRQGAP